MGATITVAGENLIAQKTGSQQPLVVSRFILANVPGLDPTAAVDRSAGKPPAAQIVGTFNVTRAGYVNTNQIVYSVMLGSDVGDFDWNYIALETAENVLLSVAYVPLQQKRKNILPQQIGNNVTRNFLLVFDGAKALTGVSIDASTWQHDFTIRLASIDERERAANRDIYGRACFLGSSLLVTRGSGAKVKIAPGTAYVEGIRVNLQEETQMDAVAGETVWVDVSLQRNLSDVVTRWSFSTTTGADKQDYTDSAGFRHYYVKIAAVAADSTLTDTRPTESIYGPLVSAYAVRNGDYTLLRARATRKEDVGLGNLPNAINHSPYIDNLDSLATSRAVNSAMVKAEQELDRLARSLGTAAKLNAGFNAGELMKVGAFGLGGAAVDISGQDPTKIVKSGLYAGNNLSNAPDSGWWFLDLHWISEGNCRQIWYSHHGTRMLTRVQIDGEWQQSYVEFYHSGNLNPQIIVPPGTVVSFAAPIAPTGYLKANGSAISRATFSGLFSVIGTTFGAGDGSTTFNLPDLRAEFVRGWDDDRGQDAGRGFGTFQAGQNASHSHTATSDVKGEHSHGIWPLALNISTSQGAGHYSVSPSLTNASTVAGAHSHTITVNPDGGNEARSRNVALLYCIKY